MREMVYDKTTECTKLPLPDNSNLMSLIPETNGAAISSDDYFLGCKRPKDVTAWGNIVSHVNLQTIPPFFGRAYLNFHYFCGKKRWVPYPAHRSSQ